MKGIRIGETSIYSEEGDGWEKLLEVMEKASKIYFKPIKGLEEKAGEEHWIIRLVRRVIRK